MAASKMAGHCSEGSITHSFILSAIDIHDGSLHPARLIRTEEGYYLRDIGWFSQANYPKLADRAFDVFVDGDTFLRRPFLEKLLPACGPHHAWLDQVNVNAVDNSLFGN